MSHVLCEVGVSIILYYLCSMKLSFLDDGGLGGPRQKQVNRLSLWRKVDYCFAYRIFKEICLAYRIFKEIFLVKNIL